LLSHISFLARPLKKRVKICLKIGFNNCINRGGSRFLDGGGGRGVIEKIG